MGQTGQTGQTGQRLTFTFTILYMIVDDARLTPPCCKKHTGSTGRRLNGSTGQRVKRVNGSLSLTILYMVADDTRLTPPRCKKHTAYHDTRLMPHRCKKHTTSFARSTGKFPSDIKTKEPDSGDTSKQSRMIILDVWITFFLLLLSLLLESC